MERSKDGQVPRLLTESQCLLGLMGLEMRGIHGSRITDAALKEVPWKVCRRHSLITGRLRDHPLANSPQQDMQTPTSQNVSYSARRLDTESEGPNEAGCDPASICSVLQDKVRLSTCKNSYCNIEYLYTVLNAAIQNMNM